MRSHIIGIAIFVSIVSLSMGLFHFYTTQEMYDPGPVVDIQPIVERQLSDSDLKDLSYSVSRAEYDVDSKTLHAYINFRWTGEGLPPGDFSIRLFVFDSETGEVISFRRSFVGSVFENERIASFSTRITDIPPDYFTRTSNIYTYLDVAGHTGEMFNSMVRLKPELTPVLLIHGKHSENN